MELKAPKGSNLKKKIVGRGPGSGHGKTSCRGQKGQKARNTAPRVGFEGGQTPLYRRLPRRGFSNFVHRQSYEIVNLGDIEKNFLEGETVNYNSLLQKGLVGKKIKKVKILAKGQFDKKVNFEVSKLSKRAEELIRQLGCEIKLV